MAQQHFDETYGENLPANYERFFVPAIGAPLATDLIRLASLRPGERVLDVACGTGVVARLASQKVGASGTVAGLDVNPGMLAVARSATSPGTSIEWHEASAEAMPLADTSFDVVLCQMGLQFIPDKRAALREMRRVLARRGRLVLNIPGPTPRLFSIMEKAFARHVGAEASKFVDHVFSLHDTEEIQHLIVNAGFREISVESHIESLGLPAPKTFLWQYVASTPLAITMSKVDRECLDSVEREVVTEWEKFVEDDALQLKVRVVEATARK